MQKEQIYDIIIRKINDVMSKEGVNHIEKIYMISLSERVDMLSDMVIHINQQRKRREL